MKRETTLLRSQEDLTVVAKESVPWKLHINAKFYLKLHFILVMKIF